MVTFKCATKELYFWKVFDELKKYIFLDLEGCQREVVLERMQQSGRRRRHHLPRWRQLTTLRWFPRWWGWLQQRQIHPEVQRQIHPEVKRQIHPELQRQIHPEFKRQNHPELQRWSFCYSTHYHLNQHYVINCITMWQIDLNRSDIKVVPNWTKKRNKARFIFYGEGMIYFQWFIGTYLDNNAYKPG